MSKETLKAGDIVTVSVGARPRNGPMHPLYESGKWVGLVVLGHDQLATVLRYREARLGALRGDEKQEHDMLDLLLPDGRVISTPSQRWAVVP